MDRSTTASSRGQSPPIPRDALNQGDPGLTSLPTGPLAPRGFDNYIAAADRTKLLFRFGDRYLLTYRPHVLDFLCPAASADQIARRRPSQPRICDTPGFMALEQTQNQKSKEKPITPLPSANR